MWSQGNAGAFSKEALTEYIRCFRNADCISASCEDYRAAATIDLEHDAIDAGKPLKTPVLALWGARGVVGKLYDVVATWKRYAEDVQGHAIPCGHFLPEEEPDQTAIALLNFLESTRCNGNN